MSDSSNEELWEPARLIPVSGIRGAVEQERRGVSALLAVLLSVREFGRTLTTRFGAPAGVIEAFIEVPFTLGDQKFRPDGLIRVTRASKAWVALVEVKTGSATLAAPQVEGYLDIARKQGFDAVITISNQIESAPGLHPVAVDRRKLKKVGLHHLSWSQIHTDAIIQKVNRSVSDPDQAWILSEFVRYLESKQSGAADLEDMGPSWVTVRDAARDSLLEADKRARDVVERFDQLLAYAAMLLSRQLGIEVKQVLSGKDLADPEARFGAQTAVLAETGRLSGSLLIPNAVAALTLTVDLRASRIECSVLVDAPARSQQQAKVNWMLRQLADAPSQLRIEAVVAYAHQAGPSATVSELLADPKIITPDASHDLRRFRLTLSRKSGKKGGQGQGSFIGAVTALVEDFYVNVVQTLKPWTPPASQVKATVKPGTGPGTATPLTQVKDESPAASAHADPPPGTSMAVPALQDGASPAVSPPRNPGAAPGWRTRP